MANPLSKFYARKNPDDDYDLGGETVQAKEAPKAAKAAKAPSASGRGPGRPKKSEGSGSEKKPEKRFTVSQLLDIVKSAGKGQVGGKASKSEKAPKLQIQWLGSSTRGRKPGNKNSPKEESALKESVLVSNPGGRPKGSKNKPKDSSAPAKTPSEGKKKPQHKFGGYAITLLKNPVMDFQLGGVKVLPALAAAGGTIALSQFVKNLPFIADMKDGHVKTLAPAATVLAGAMALAYFMPKNQLAKEVARDMATFGVFLGVSDLAGSWIHDQVNKLRKEDAPALPAPPAPTEPAANGFHGGRFQSQMNGGAWKGLSNLDGYVSRNPNSQGYPPMTGSSGYPPAIERATDMMGGANAVDTSVGISQMHGGRFASQAPLGGIDMNGFAD